MSNKEIHYAPYDVEDEAYKFATSNGLGNAGVAMFKSAHTSMGFNAPLTLVRLEALRRYDESKKETEIIVNSVKNDTELCISFHDLEPAEPPVQSEQYRPHDWGDPHDAA